MGEVAEAIVNGYLCESCGSIVDGDAPGYPRTCTDCEEEGEVVDV